MFLKKLLTGEILNDIFIMCYCLIVASIPAMLAMLAISFISTFALLFYPGLIFLIGGMVYLICASFLIIKCFKIHLQKKRLKA